MMADPIPYIGGMCPAPEQVDGPNERTQEEWQEWPTDKTIGTEEKEGKEGTRFHVGHGKVWLHAVPIRASTFAQDAMGSTRS